ncbi:MAG: type 2 isopentenyl-diphosphate Delta-isomerase [Saprospiraceae bacterium]|nr:type 2 isopentenyl-diphosphate Delta-isomerase [Saprospiraceae bacterium]
MVKPDIKTVTKPDPGASDRKKDHIELAFKSRVGHSLIDTRFSYEPALSGHPVDGTLQEMTFLGKKFKAPIWVSSMTGGTQMAGVINRNLAKACGQFGLGMGLGSCRQLLHSNTYLNDFDVRKYMPDQPLYANLGIAQVEQLISRNEIYKINELVKKLSADGLIVHINPMQEWLQPEGDRYFTSPVDTIKRILDAVDIKLIVKEVGQGMGKASLRALFELPLEAIDFAASGGTNFALLELLRSSKEKADIYGKLANLGHTAEEMVDYVNQLKVEMGDKMSCRQVIISGGVEDFLDGYYLTQKITIPSVYGQASAFLKHAMGDYEDLELYIRQQIDGLALAKTFLKIKE